MALKIAATSRVFLFSACAPVLLLAVASGCRPTMRVATFNMAHGRGTAISQIGLPREAFEENLAAVAEALKREAPDVVALQEADAASTWSGGFDHVAFVADLAEYPHRHHGLHVDFDRGGVALRYGTALLGRRELFERSSYAFNKEPVDTKGYALAQVDFAGRPVVLVSVHLDFKSAAIRRAQARALVTRLRRCRAPLILLGDFNAVWDRPRDAVRLIANELNLHAYQPGSDDRATHPSADPRRRIDWILVSRELRFVDQWRWDDRVSDHLGVMAELAWR